jgi:hypothetical protein
MFHWDVNGNMNWNVNRLFDWYMNGIGNLFFNRIGDWDVFGLLFFVAVIMTTE